jgi:hypothetical protein
MASITVEAKIFNNPADFEWGFGGVKRGGLSVFQKGAFVECLYQHQLC